MQTPNCTPEPGLADCDDEDPERKPGNTENCHDLAKKDEDCNLRSNCEDEYCWAGPTAECDAQCDKDGDEHYSEACGGDDCNDECVLCYPGVGRRENEGLSPNCSDGDDNDCDDLIDCADPDCAEDESCPGEIPPPPTPVGGGGPTYYSNPYCYSEYAVYEWYISYDGGETWSYFYTEYEYVGSYCYMS